MAVKIRLMRMGKKKRPSYRVVAKEARSPRSGKYIEQIGFYNPLADPVDVRFEEERVKYWLGNGAQPTETVARLLKQHSSIEL
jgi:small subunit ribosomal protein S16